MYKYSDGGRSKAGYKGKSGDCGARAVSIATGMEYRDAIKLMKDFSEKGKLGSRAIANGVYKEDMDSALKSLGWEWVSAPKFNGRKARYSDIPETAILRMARHYAAVVDGVLLDSWDSSDKMVYGYWAKL